MHFVINHDMLDQTRAALGNRKRLYWIVGGAGSGKTTICQFLSARYNLLVYDMDASIYGAYHNRFTQEFHPVNKAWSSADNGLAWLLDMSWDDFDRFQQAAVPEYLGLLAEDLAATDPSASVLIDGGIYHPALIGKVISSRQIVCLAAPERSSTEIWEEAGERKAMKEAISQLPKADQAWQNFLEFDERITQTIIRECQENRIAVCSRNETDSVGAFAEKVAQALPFRHR